MTSENLRKQAEGALQDQPLQVLEESRSKYADLYDLAPISYFTFDKNGIILEVNLTGATKLGVERGFLIKKPFSFCIVPDSRDVFYSHLQQVFRTRTQQTCEIKLVGKGGIQFDAQLESLLVQDSEGKSSQCRTVIIDITGHKRAEEETRRLLIAVQQEKDRLSARINSINDEVWFADTQKRFILANSAALREFGLDSAERIGVEKLARSLEVYRPDGSPRPVDEAPTLHALQGEVVTKHEEIVRTPASGELRYRQVSAAPVRDAELELMLIQERDKAKKLLDIAGVIILALDTEGRVTLTNEKACEILACIKEEIVGKDWFETFLPERIQDEMKAAFKKLISGDLEPVEYFENPILMSRGEERIIAWHNSIIWGEKGKIIGTLSSGEDITERKQIEEALRKVYDELEIRVQERTAELKEAEASYRELTESIGEIFFAMDKDLKYTYWNKASETSTGISAKDAIGKSLYEFSPEIKIIAASGLAEKDKLKNIADHTNAFLPKPYTAEKLLGTIHDVLSMK
ncbi:MAG: PAS domain S-box protein [Candidatus Methanoperedens sp.]|nr:PAS domain S-box protein [Candidatus Methanoperedens sp.]